MIVVSFSSVYTHERCRFGRGCLFAHSKEELQEWIQEFQKKEKEKLRRELEGQDEVTTLEMASQILKGPSQDVSGDKLIVFLILNKILKQHNFVKELLYEVEKHIFNFQCGAKELFADAGKLRITKFEKQR